MSSTRGHRVLALGMVIFVGAVALIAATIAAPHPSDCPAYIGSAPDCGSSGPVLFMSAVVLGIAGFVLMLVGLAVRRDDIR